ncbi:acyl-CoA reductase [Adhaeribacter radiodurans]|uniref:Acyl-CoA reductase n=1 Tax=Adhaeribacter radiodurans TaxID=2745197 RepID=A0A7L7LBH2_9BACT|nr:acyl-CoA reductase [Adhaeribacter radiodurans]QMU30054.1 acyl-CoA reductase [Adhaeribacter radiodurans]
MLLENRLQTFIQLGRQLNALLPEQVQDLAQQARRQNAWFDEPNVQQALSNIASMLNESQLRTWLAAYNLENLQPRKVGVVMAGNIPLVGFHDLLTVLLSGNYLYAKLSSEDTFLPKWLVQQLITIEPEFKDFVLFVDLLKDVDAVIATGSDNTARYFEYYFAKKPHIIRRNRSSLAVLTGFESPEELAKLGSDIFQYYGLGCRNVSKLFVPEGYNPEPFFQALEPFKGVLDHHKYANNYDYNKSILLVNQTPHYDNGFLLLTENKQLVSPISVIHLETYSSQEDLKQKLKALEEKIQCIISALGWYQGSIPFGEAQCPTPSQYADNVDTLAFLSGLNSWA